MDPDDLLHDGDGLTSLAFAVDSNRADGSDEEGMPRAPSEAGTQRNGMQTPPRLTPVSVASKDKGKEKVRCKCCQKSFLPTELAMNSPYCKRDKQAMDNLTHQAHNQNCTQWWKECRQDQVKLKAAVEKYNLNCPETSEKKRRHSFAFGVFREEYEASSIARTKEMCPLMHLERWMEYAQSHSCFYGKMDAKAAKDKWEEFASTPKIGSDDGGPAGSTKRYAIQVEQMVERENAFKRSRGWTLSQKTVKAPDEKQHGDNMRSLFKAHDQLSESAGIDFEMRNMSDVLLQGAASSATGSAFTGPGVFVANVAGIKEQLEIEEQEKADAKAKALASKKLKNEGREDATPTKRKGSDEEESQEVADEEAVGVKPKKLKWFDPTNVLKAQTSAINMLDGIEKDLEKALVQSTALELSWAGMSAMHQTSMKNELKTLQDRRRWVVTVLGRPAATDSLEILKNMVDMKSLKSPCDMFLKLQLLPSAREGVEQKFKSLEEECSSQDQLKAALAQLKSQCIPFKNILGSLTKATRDWNGKLSSMKRVEEQEAKARAKAASASKGGGAPGKAKGAPSGKPIFEVGAQVATQLPSINWEEVVTADFSKPFLCRRADDAKTVEAENLSLFFLAGTLAAQSVFVFQGSVTPCVQLATLFAWFGLRHSCFSCCSLTCLVFLHLACSWHDGRGRASGPRATGLLALASLVN
jgi:hypothetical protein